MPEEPPPLTLDGLAAYITAWGASVDPTEDAEAASSVGSTEAPHAVMYACLLYTSPSPRDRG